MPELPQRAPLKATLSSARIIVAVGTGGVGKTTTAAALALAAADAGRRAVVVTVDPARRLADALGLDELANEPRVVAGAGRDGGALYGAMLDPRATFDEMVTRGARDDSQRDRILNNRFYQNIAGNLAGTHEYMAMEKLYELSRSDQFDLVVVDTPPNRDALAFLDAPRLFARLLDNWLYKLLVLPSRGLARTAAAGAQTLVRQLTRVVGAEVIDDTISFFRALDGIEESFRLRANEVYRTLQSDQSAFVLVVSPRPDTLDDAAAFAATLAGADMAVRAVVVNRTTPVFDTNGVSGKSAAARALADFVALAARETDAIDAFRAEIGDVPVVRVPMLADDVADLASLRAIGTHLLGPKR